MSTSILFYTTAHKVRKKKLQLIFFFAVVFSPKCSAFFKLTWVTETHDVITAAGQK